MNIPNTRSKEEILQDIENLCKSRGYAHALAFLCLESNFIQPDALSNHEKKAALHWEAILRAESELLIGFMIKGEMSNALNDIKQKDIESYIKESKKLLSELHQALIIKIEEEMIEILNDEHKDENEKKDDSKNVLIEKGLKENFFYGPETAYEWQYEKFFIKKYAYDDNWLYQEKGFTSKEAKEVISTVIKIIKTQVSKFLYYYSILNAEEPLKEPEYYLNNILDFSGIKESTLRFFIIQKENIIKNSTIPPEIIEKVLNAFSIGSTPCNKGFKEHGDFNEFNAQPLIKIDDENYISFQYRNLLKSIYQSPYFWMLESSYKNKANENRGKFVENTVAELLKKVFGEDNVYENVLIRTPSGRDEAGEIDILVIYANRAIVVQTKAKSMILEAIKGDAKAIKNDFQKAIQDPYNQCFDCSILLLNEDYILQNKNGKKLNIRRDFAEIFTMCIVGDTYHGLASQLLFMLEVKEHDIIQKPYITDVFVLGALCEFLDTPIHFLNFQHKKAMYFENIPCSNELSILAYYLSNNLFLKEEEKEDNFLQIDDKFSFILDEAFTSREERIEGTKIPEGILTKFNGTLLEHVIKELNNHEEDKSIELAYFLLDLSTQAIQELSNTFEKITQKTNEDKSLHDFFSIYDEAAAAIVAHVSFDSDSEAYKKLFSHCEIIKYRHKLKLCFGVLLNTNPEESTFRMFLCNNSPWEKSKEMDEVIKKFPCPKIVKKP